MQIIASKEFGAGIKINSKNLLNKGNFIEWCESFSGLINEAKNDGCVSNLDLSHLTCSRSVFSQLWSAIGVQDTGLTTLTLNGLPNSLSVKVLTLLQ